MIRLSISAVCFIALMSFTGCTNPVVREDNPATAMRDAAEIYEGFLKWLIGNEKKSVSVSMVAWKPTAEDFKIFTDCARKSSDGIRLIPPDQIEDLGKTIGRVPNINFVDPRKWKPRNPRAFSAPGEEVDFDAQGGLADGLTTVSAIAFDESRTTAVFRYSFLCGSLCGGGGVEIYTKAAAGWVRSENRCGLWVS